MESNFYAMMTTAQDKYVRLNDIIYQLKNGSVIDYDKLFKLIYSIHKDGTDLIIKLCEIEMKMENNNEPKKEIQVCSFISK